MVYCCIVSDSYVAVGTQRNSTVTLKSVLKSVIIGTEREEFALVEELVID